MSRGASRDEVRLPWPGEAQQLDSLREQVGWFNRLRLVVGASVLWLTAVGSHVLGLVASPWPLYALGGLLLLIDGLYILLYPRLLAWSIDAVRRHVYLQIAVDLSILTALLHWTGGVTNPLALFFLFHAFIAALVLSVPAAVVVAAASLCLLVGLGIAERQGWLLHHPLAIGLADLHAIEPLGFWLLVFAYVVTLAFSIYFVATVLARLRANERQLVALGRHFAQSEKLASLGTLAAGVSHEINNPLGVIRNKVQILRYRAQDGETGERLLADLDTIDKHLTRVAQITAGLLQFAREQPFELKPIDVPALLREAADLVRVPFRTAAVELAVGPAAPALPLVLGSANHLLQVLINILLNAKDASPPGALVRLYAEPRGGDLLLVVQDHGTGIAPDVLGKVFDPFFTTKDVDKGTGLGLAISHGIVERHRGRIEVDSELGRGTTFRVVLPAAGGATAPNP